MEKLFTEKRLVMRIAIIATGIFLSWISGDFPLALWLQITSSGRETIFASLPGLFLGIQLLCLALAWSILLWMALYECIAQLVALPFMRKKLFLAEVAWPGESASASSKCAVASPPERLRSDALAELATQNPAARLHASAPSPTRGGD